MAVLTALSQIESGFDDTTEVTIRHPGTAKLFFSSLAWFFFAVNPSDLGQRLVLPHLSGVKILCLIGYWIPVVLVLISVLPVVVPETPGNSSQLAVTVSKDLSQAHRLVSGTPSAGTIPGKP